MYIFELASYLVVAILFGIGAGWLIWGDEPFEATPVADLPGSEQAVADLSSQVETRDQEIVRLRKRLKRMHADMDARDLNLAEVKGRSDELEGLLSQRETEMQAMLNGDPLPTGDSDVNVRRVSELEELLSASRSEADGLARKLQDTISNEVHVPDPELEHRLADAETRFAQANESRTQLAAAHEELQRSHATISNDLAEAQARLDEVASGADLAEHDRIRVLEAEISRLRGAESAARDQAAEAEHLHQSAVASLQASEQRANELHQQIAAQPMMAQGASEDVELELAKVHAELARSRQNVNSLRQRLQSVEDENETLAGDLARATTELQGRSARNAEAAAQRDQVVAARDQLLTERRQVEEERDQLASDVAQLRLEVQQMRDQSVQERTAVEERLGEAVASAQAAQQRAEELESQLTLAASNTEETQRLQLSVSEMQHAHEATVAQLHVELSDARLRADDAYEALHELNEEFINFRDVTMRQQNTMNSLADRLARANKSLGSRTVTPDDSSGE